MEEVEKDTIDTCASCGCQLHEAEECYYLNEQYYCRECVESAIVILDYKN